MGFVVSAGALELQLQRFLGFANFYRRNYSTLAAPLTALTSSAVCFHWSSAADEAFEALKSRFTSAPILMQPDPNEQFIVEVDTSDVGVGAILSQVHLCAFFSHRLSPAERNYDVGDWELLAVKLALEEWRHWLEEGPFLVWTEHKNLEYLRSAKCLNPRQARWSLFFHDLISLSPIALAQRMVSLMPSPVHSAVQTVLLSPLPFYQNAALLMLPYWTLSP